MIIYRCLLVLADTVFFATREMGRLYETEKYLHNWALSYALGFSTLPYHTDEDIPKYREHAQAWNEQQVYVTPARPLSCDFVLNTFKFANIKYHVEMIKPRSNIPSYGRVKELAPESEFEFFITSEVAVKIPKWVRLGKWMSKVSLEAMELEVPSQTKEGEFVANYPLNPLDLAHEKLFYDIISMPPVSLINNARLRGPYYECRIDEHRKVNLPARMRYFAADRM